MTFAIQDRTQLGEQLLNYTEQIGVLLSVTLDPNTDMNVMDNFTYENIGMLLTCICGI